MYRHRPDRAFVPYVRASGPRAAARMSLAKRATVDAYVCRCQGERPRQDKSWPTTCPLCSARA
eukprot:3487546-Lingulodinium_polyedra.AAC.1